jgi:hypothetical protein
VHLPELNANQALELEYTLETKTTTLLADKDIHEDAQKTHPVAVEPSFAFRWNDTMPALKRELSIKYPKLLPLLGVSLRSPNSMAVTEDKLSDPRTTRFSLNGVLDPVPFEGYQPALQDLAPLTAFTVYKSWEDTVFNYRKRVKQILDADLGPVNRLMEEVETTGNTGTAFAERLAGIKNAIHRKVDWVDTGLPVYLNPGARGKRLRLDGPDRGPGASRRASPDCLGPAGPGRPGASSLGHHASLQRQEPPQGARHFHGIPARRLLEVHRGHAGFRDGGIVLAPVFPGYDR